MTDTLKRTSGRTSAASCTVAADDQYHFVHAGEAHHDLLDARIEPARARSTSLEPRIFTFRRADSVSSGSSGR